MKDYKATVIENEKIAENVYAVTFDVAVRLEIFPLAERIFFVVRLPFVKRRVAK